MASITFSGTTGNFSLLPTAAVSENSNHIKDGFNPLEKNLSNTRKKHNGRSLVSTYVASPPLPSIAHPPLKRESGNGYDGSHVAWTSVRQERWEGELLVQGEIPLWLVMEANHQLHPTTQAANIEKKVMEDAEMDAHHLHRLQRTGSFTSQE